MVVVQKANELMLVSSLVWSKGKWSPHHKVLLLVAFGKAAAFAFPQLFLILLNCCWREQLNCLLCRSHHKCFCLLHFGTHAWHFVIAVDSEYTEISRFLSAVQYISYQIYESVKLCVLSHRIKKSQRIQAHVYYYSGGDLIWNKMISLHSGVWAKF